MEAVMRNERRGASGATFSHSSSTVTKYGDARVMWQGRWIQAHECVSLPVVYYTHEDGFYTMERLSHPDRTGLTVKEMITALRYIWRQEVEDDELVSFDRQKALEYLLPRTFKYAPETTTPLSDALYFIDEAIERGLLRAHLTHGDPTRDNMMIRRSSRSRDLVIIDPLPATSYAPSFRAVDLGKILQSAAGYEYDRYEIGFHTSSHLRTDMFKIAQMFGETEAQAALRFALVHLVRALPYAPADARTRLRKNSIRNILEML